MLFNYFYSIANLIVTFTNKSCIFKEIASSLQNCNKKTTFFYLLKRLLWKSKWTRRIINFLWVVPMFDMWKLEQMCRRLLVKYLPWWSLLFFIPTLKYGILNIIFALQYRRSIHLLYNLQLISSSINIVCYIKIFNSSV